MSEQGVEALWVDRAEVLAVTRTLSDDEWAAPSDCAGWRVQDVVAHMANVCRSVVDPGALAPGVPGDLEATQAAQADAHRDWTSARVLADYEEVTERAVGMLAGLQAPEIAETVVPIEDAGHYPLHLVANALAFDHYCHLRNDILRPNGPIDRPAPPSDGLRVGATLEWLIAGLPQMHAEGLRAAVTGPVELRLTGPGGGEWSILPATDDEHDEPVAVAPGGATEPQTIITSPASEFMIWGTRRRPWREREVGVTGDDALATQVLDAIHLF